MRPFKRTIKTLELDGGTLCLNFVNSVKNRFEKPVYEFLVAPDDWILWSHRTQICDELSKQKLSKYVSENSEKAIKELNRIIKVREVLYGIFRNIAQKKSPLTEDIRIFNYELSFSFGFLNIGISDNLETISIWNYKETDLLYSLLPIMKSAYELLTTDLKEHIKECPNCGWLYLDKSKNNSRIWCNMKTCGNTMKIKKYYEKNKILGKKDKTLS